MYMYMYDTFLCTKMLLDNTLVTYYFAITEIFSKLTSDKKLNMFSAFNVSLFNCPISRLYILEDFWTCLKSFILEKFRKSKFLVFLNHGEEMSINNLISSIS